MSEQVKKFLSMLQVELEDLEDSIRTMIDTTEERFKRHEITGYVWTENRALLMREVNLLKMVRKSVAGIDPSKYGSIAEARTAVAEELKEFVDMPAAIPDLIERRIDKIVRYLREE
jgi:hypothetical protein